jgi:uncharacterized protein YjbJ (UPF0337 family)
MDMDRFTGAVRQATGRLKGFIGRLLGDPKLEADGAKDRIVGSAESAAGGMKDKLRQMRSPS